jgi:hypothetical protein
MASKKGAPENRQVLTEKRHRCRTCHGYPNVELGTGHTKIGILSDAAGVGESYAFRLTTKACAVIDEEISKLMRYCTVFDFG